MSMVWQKSEPLGENRLKETLMKDSNEYNQIKSPPRKSFLLFFSRNKGCAKNHKKETFVRVLILNLERKELFVIMVEHVAIGLPLIT